MLHVPAGGKNREIEDWFFPDWEKSMIRWSQVESGKTIRLGHRLANQSGTGLA
jgi:hypothetical protein